MRGQKEAFQAAINGAPLEDSLGILARIVSEETAGEARTAFYIADPDVTFLDPIRGAGNMPESYTKRVEGFVIGKDSLACGLATATGRPVLTRDVFEEPLWKPWVHLAEEYDFRGCWSFPIETRDGKPIGTFAQYFTMAREATPHDLALADTVTQAAAIIISRHTEAQERAGAEEALRTSEERYRLAVEAADLGRWELVSDTGEFFTSAACNRHLGLPEDARPTLEGHFECIHPDDHATIRDGLKRASLEGGEYEAEYRVIRPDGAVRRILSRARVLRDSGSTPDCLTGVTLDVTEARELEEERERARARELTSLAEAAERERIRRELHDRVAHQSLELYSVLREADPERAKERLDLARETTRVALDQTRALSAELKRLQEEELSDGLEAAFSKLAEYYASEGVEMEVTLAGEESAIPGLTAMQIYLAMREAIKNAVRHSGCSCIGVSLEVGDGELHGAVEDDGNGFDPEAADGATPSWGVGLRSMRERTEMLGGSTRVESAPGAGTRVEVRVPLDRRRP